MNSKVTNNSADEMSGIVVTASEIKVGDQICFDDSDDNFVTVTYADENLIRAEDSKDIYLFPLTQEYIDLLGALPAGALSDAIEGGTDTEGEEGETEGADFSIPSLDDVMSLGRKVVKTTGDGAGWVGRKALGAGKDAYNVGSDVTKWAKRQTYDRAFNPNDDITNPGSKSIKPGDLLPGDILLKKMHEDDLTSFAIHKAQLLLNRLQGFQESEKLTHALIYVGDNKVIEAVDNGVGVSPLRSASSFNDANYNNYDFFVLRCRHPRVREAAVREAKSLIPESAASSMAIFEKSTPIRVGYDHRNLYLTMGYKSLLPGDVAKILDHARSLVDSTTRVKEQLRTNDNPKLFCSELVAYCYHLAADACGMRRFFNDRQQSILSPEHLYVYGRQDQANFDYMGRLPTGVS